MKSRLFLLSMTITVLTFGLLGGCCYGQNYVPTANEECYGTWINEKTINQGHIQKKISSSEGNKDYLEVSDTDPLFEDEQQIYAKWIDSEGNIWYKTFGTVIVGAYKGTKWQELDKLSKSATVWEYVFAIVSEFDPKSYPTKIDQKEPNYRIFYRSKDKYIPKPDEESYGTWINKEIFPQKQIVTPNGRWMAYRWASGSVPDEEGTVSIDSKWTDSEGNIWQKTSITETSGSNKGKFQGLDRYSKSATVWEGVLAIVKDFDPNGYPTRIDPKDSSYRLFYRAEK